MIDLAAYERDGFAISSPLMNEGEIDRARETVDDLHRRALSGDEPELSAVCVFERDQPERKRAGRSLSAGEDAVFILGDPTRFAPQLLQPIVNDALLRIVSQVLGTDFFVIHFANITSKAPEIGSGISWHRDYPNKYICPAEPRMVRTMICLDGMENGNGATHFIPGSHLDGVEADLKGEDDLRAVVAHCVPGAVAAIHPRVLHGGAPNATATPRRNIVVQWGTRDCPLVTEARESLTGLTVHQLRERVRSSGTVR